MIRIKEDYRYFTHLFGKESVIPLSKSWAKIYPTRCEVFSEENGKILIELQLFSEVKDFTHLLNIEKQRVEFFGKNKEGYFHFYLFAKSGFIFIKYHRGFPIDLLIKGKKHFLEKGQNIKLIASTTIEKRENLEKITFGCSKKPLLEKNIDRDSRLYVLSQLIPFVEGKELEENSIKALLVDLFSPKTEDINFTGIEIDKNKREKFALFSSFRKNFREKLFHEKEGEIFFIPLIKMLPHSGRVLSIYTRDLVFDILWKKNKIIRCVIYPKNNCSKKLKFFPLVKKYRIKKTFREKGKFVEGEKSIFLEKGQKLYIDKIIY